MGKQSLCDNVCECAVCISFHIQFVLLFPAVGYKQWFPSLPEAAENARQWRFVLQQEQSSQDSAGAELGALCPRCWWVGHRECWGCQGTTHCSVSTARRIWKAWARPDLRDLCPPGPGLCPCPLWGILAVPSLLPRCGLGFKERTQRGDCSRGFFCPPAIPSWSSALEEQPVLFPFPSFSLSCFLRLLRDSGIEYLQWTWVSHSELHRVCIPLKYYWIFCVGHHVWGVDLVLCVLFWKVLWALISPRSQGEVGHLDTHRHVGGVAVWALICSFWD